MRGSACFLLAAATAVCLLLGPTGIDRGFPTHDVTRAACTPCHFVPVGTAPAIPPGAPLPPGHPTRRPSAAGPGPLPAVAPGGPAGLPPDGDEDDAQEERLAFDLMRLRDPATGRIPPDIRARELAFARSLPVNRGRVAVDAGRPEAAPRTAADKIPGWTSRGPWSISGRVRALAIDLADPTYHTLLAAGVSGGLWRSVDDGNSWTLLTPPAELHNIAAIVQDPRPGHLNVWYYGTGEGRGSLSMYNRNIYSNEGWGLHGNGVYRSVDGGLTWSVLPATSSGTPQAMDSRWDYIWGLAVDPSETVADEIYAAAFGVVYRSLDGGDTWAAVLGDEANSSFYADVVVSSEGVVYAALGQGGAVWGIFRSPDGASWTDITPAGYAAQGRITLTLAPSDETIVYVVGSQIDGGYYTSLHRYRYLAGDGSGAGGEWDDRSSSILTLPDVYYGSYPFNSQRGYNQCLAVHPADPDFVLLGGVHLWRSLDGFATGGAVQQVGGWLYDGHHADVHAVIYKPGGTAVVYTASDGGVHKSGTINGSSPVWVSKNNGLVTTQYYTVAVDLEAPGNDVVVAGTQDNGTHWTASADPQGTWLEVLGGDGAHCMVKDAAAGEYYLSWYRGNVVYYLLDPAGGYLAGKLVKPVTDDGFLFINPFVIDPADEDVMYLASDHGVWRNSDLTAVPLENWDPTPLNWLKLTSVPEGVAVSALAVSRGEVRTLYYGTAGGELYRVDGADAAPAYTTPVDLTPNAAFPPGYVSTIAVDPDDDARVLVGFSNYDVSSIWLSEDAGASWSEIEGNLGGADGPSIRCLAVIPYGGVTFHFAGTSTGLYSAQRLAGEVTIWTQESPDDVGNCVVEAMTGRSSDGLLVAATHGRGIWSTHIPTGTAAPDGPPPVLLAQNAPNPFNPSTEIAFDLPSAGRARLEIYDVRGRLVRRLLDADLDAGPQRVRWDGSDGRGRPAAAGTYVYRLSAPGIAESRSMSLVR